MKELLLFQAGNIEFGLNLPLVKSIHSVNARFAGQTGRSHKLVQVMDGKEFPLYDLPTILTDETSSVNPLSQKVILVEANEHPIALGVDRVKQVVSVNGDNIHPLPLIFNGLSKSLFPWVLKQEHELILLVNPEEIETLKTIVPDSVEDSPKPEIRTSSLEDKEVLEPLVQASSDSKNLHQNINHASEIDNGEPASFTPNSESASPDKIKNDQSKLKNNLSGTFQHEAGFKEQTAREELLQKESIQFEGSIVSAEPELIVSEPSAMDTSSEDTLADTQDSDIDDTKERAVAADVDEIEAEVSNESFQPEESNQQGQVETEPSAMKVHFEDVIPYPEEDDSQDLQEMAAVNAIDDTVTESPPGEEIPGASAEGDCFELNSNDHPAYKIHEEDPDAAQYAKEIHKVDEENQLLSSIGMNLDSTDKFSSPLEEEKPVDSDVLSQLPAGQPEEIVSLKEVENAVDLQEPESTDPFQSVKVVKDIPPLPVGEVPYLFAAVSTEYEPIPTEPAEEVSLKEADAMVETPEEESTDPFRSVKEDEDTPILPVGEVPYLFAAISTESEPILTEPAEEVSLKESEVEVEVPEPVSTDHFRSAEKNTAALIMPVSEGPSLLDGALIESEQIIKEPSHTILLDSSDIVIPESDDRFEKVLAPTKLPIELVIDDGKQKDSYRGRITAAVLMLVAILLLSIWLLPKSSLKVSEVVRKPIPIAYAIQEDREKSPEPLQTSQPLNDDEKTTVTEHTSQKVGTEILKIETSDFTLTVERPKATDKNAQPPTSAGMTGKYEYSHIVVQDDTLWQIAERYLDDPFRYPELAERSRISNPDRIYPGDVVRIVTKKEQREGRKGKSSQ